MNCGACENAVKNALKEVSNVSSVEVSLAGGSATVQHDGADPAALCAAVEEEGYEAEVAAAA